LKQRSTILDGCYEQFDEVVESCRVNCRKPEKQIYQVSYNIDVLIGCPLQIMLDKLQMKPENCVFVDDLEHNVSAAEKMGFTGIVVSKMSLFPE
jgi:FMN phosphatase YigB (HAD superfamily)